MYYISVCFGHLALIHGNGKIQQLRKRSLRYLRLCARKEMLEMCLWVWFAEWAVRTAESHFWFGRCQHKYLGIRHCFSVAVAVLTTKAGCKPIFPNMSFSRVSIALSFAHITFIVHTYCPQNSRPQHTRKSILYSDKEFFFFYFRKKRS